MRDDGPGRAGRPAGPLVVQGYVTLDGGLPGESDQPCQCGRPARGLVDADDVAPRHLCRQCSTGCCLLRDYLERRAQREQLRPVVPGQPTGEHA